MLELVVKLAAALLLEHDPPLHQLAEGRAEDFDRAPSQSDHTTQRHRPPHNRQQLEQRTLRRVKPPQLRRHPLGQTFGQATKLRGGQVSGLVQQRSQQPDRVQRVAPGPLAHPVHQNGRRRLLDHRFGQRLEPRAIKGTELDARQKIIFVELEQHLRRDIVLRKFGRTARRHDQQSSRVEMAREIPQPLPRGRIREMHVIQHNHQRRPLRQPTQEASQPLQQARERRIAPRHRATNRRDPRKHARQIIESTPAQLYYLVIRQRLKERIDRLSPQAKRRTRSKRIPPREQANRVPAVPQ